ncbi:MAG: hypothetical protein JNM09_10895 [Blastocatellia bacterium]|nr:hypothetical protein [Blastocatellia bacterium]
MSSTSNSISNQGKIDDDMILEDKIYEALRERGWLIPETEEEVLRALTEMEIDPIDFPSELAVPPKLAGEPQNGATPLASKDSKAQVIDEPLGFSTAVKSKTVLEFLRESTGKKPSEISNEMGANTIFLSNISRYADVIDISTRQKIANIAEQKFQVPANAVMHCFEQSRQEKVAALRKTSFGESKAITYEEIVNSSGMNEEAKRFWLSLAKKGLE